MAYSELIKNFDRVRGYMREFYIYGFKSRNEYTKKSARAYDDEKRRIENWLGDYMRFRQTSEGKNVFLSIDTRVAHHNPLYAALKTKSFTDGDITLHFILFDILHSTEVCLNLNEIMEEIDRYLTSFDNPKTFDVSSVRKKLNEYVEEGIIVTEKRGKTMYYRRADNDMVCDTDILDFFSEVSPCGVIGSFILDKQEASDKHFGFKHHYITSALDSEIVCSLLMAMTEKKAIHFVSVGRRTGQESETYAVPLKIMCSAQSGRQYLLAYVPRYKRISSYRIDYINSVKIDEVKAENFDELRCSLDKMKHHMWGVSTDNGFDRKIAHMEFAVKYTDDESYIHHRLEREKRCGVVERIDNNASRYIADVYNDWELIPWIRTFICRITDINFSNKELETQFRKDIEDMYALYGLKEGEPE